MMRRFAKLSLAAAAILTATACGFQPMYAPQGGGAGLFAALEVAAGDTRAHYLVMRGLQQRLAPAGSKAAQRGRLELRLRERSDQLGLLPDGSATRSDLVLEGAYQLIIDADTERFVRGVLTVTATYAIPSSAYGEVAALEDARARAADQLADLIARDIAYKLRQPRSAAAP
jgi:LPS-assembly lipoprotein